MFISGGARSGKSSFAEALAKRINLQAFENERRIAYAAAGIVVDEEFEKRIEAHRQRRGDIFKTYEEGYKADELLESIYDDHDVFVFECASTWLGNLYYKYEDNLELADEESLLRAKRLVGVFSAHKDILNDETALNCIYNSDKFVNDINSLFRKSLPADENSKTLILVSNEVGLSIVPENKVARMFRDSLGGINKLFAYASDYAFLAVAGMPVRIK